MKPKRLWQRIKNGHLNNVAFDDFCRLIESFGFRFARQQGTSHQIYDRDDVREILTVHPQHDGTAWPYQIRQFRNLVARYDLKQDGEGSAL